MAGTSNFHIVGRTADLPDPLRDYNWQVFIDRPTCCTNWDSNQMLLRAQSANIPGKAITTIDTAFMGMKQFFSANATLDNTLAVEFLEFEDRKTDKYLREWLDAIFNTNDANSTAGGHSSARHKGEYATTMKVTTYNQDGTDNAVITFHNTWLKDFGAVSLAYPGGAGVKYSANFSWDYYSVEYKDVVTR